MRSAADIWHCNECALRPKFLLYSNELNFVRNKDPSSYFWCGLCFVGISCLMRKTEDRSNFGIFFFFGWCWLGHRRKANNLAWPTLSIYVIQSFTEHINVLNGVYRFWAVAKQLVCYYCATYFTDDPSTRAVAKPTISLLLWSSRFQRWPRTMKNEFLAKWLHFTHLTRQQQANKNNIIGERTIIGYGSRVSPWKLRPLCMRPLLLFFCGAKIARHHCYLLPILVAETMVRPRRPLCFWYVGCVLANFVDATINRNFGILVKNDYWTLSDLFVMAYW